MMPFIGSIFRPKLENSNDFGCPSVHKYRGSATFLAKASIAAGTPGRQTDVGCSCKALEPKAPPHL